MLINMIEKKIEVYHWSVKYGEGPIPMDEKPLLVLPPSLLGSTCREMKMPAGVVEGVPVHYKAFGAVDMGPPPSTGEPVWYVVPRAVREALLHRQDLLTPADILVEYPDLIYCRSFESNKQVQTAEKPREEIFQEVRAPRIKFCHLCKDGFILLQELSDEPGTGFYLGTFPTEKAAVDRAGFASEGSYQIYDAFGDLVSCLPNKEDSGP